MPEQRGKSALTEGARRALLVGGLLAVTLHAFVELAVVTALPFIVEELQGRALYGAAFFAYLLASLLGLVAAGWQADRYGPQRPFALGLTLFFAGLLLAAVAPSMPMLVAARALQGLGGGLISTVVLFVVGRAFDDAERPRVMALLSAAWVVPALLAPAGAGAIVELWGWRWVLLGLTPLVALAAILAVPAMGALRGSALRRADDAGAWRTTLDGLRIAAGTGLLLFGMGRAASALTLLGMLVGVTIAAGSLRRVLPAGVWTARPMLAAAIALKALIVFAFFGAEAFLPLALVEIHGTSATYAGLALTSASLSWTAAAFLQSRLAPNIAPAWLLAAGAAGLLVAIALLFPLANPEAPAALAFVAWSIGGASIGFAYNTVNVAAMASTPVASQGHTSTALGVADALGISLATGMGGAIVGMGDRIGRTTGDSLEIVWGLMAAVALLALLAARRLRPAEQPEPVVAQRFVPVD